MELLDQDRAALLLTGVDVNYQFRLDRLKCSKELIRNLGKLDFQPFDKLTLSGQHGLDTSFEVASRMSVTADGYGSGPYLDLSFDTIVLSGTASKQGILNEEYLERLTDDIAETVAERIPASTPNRDWVVEVVRQAALVAAREGAKAGKEMR